MSRHELHQWKRRILHLENRHGRRDVALRRQFNARLRALRGGDDTIRHFYFISDIEGCYDTFSQPGLQYICDHAQQLPEGSTPTLCILGDIPDRCPVEKQKQVYEDKEWGLCRDASGTVGTNLQEVFGDPAQIVRILGNRDGNKLRLWYEPEVMKAGHRESYPDWGGRNLIYTHGGEGRMLSSFGIQGDPDVSQLKPQYLNYAKNAVICGKLVENALYCSHACPPWTDEDANWFNQTYQDKIQQVPSATHDDDEYLKPTAEVDYTTCPERFVADISGPHAAVAWAKMKTPEDTSVYGPVVRPGPPQHEPTYLNKTTAESCNMNLEEDTVKSLRGAVGHQPVGYFPYVRNGLLCTDVSAANEQGFQGTQRESVPMIYLQFKHSTDWKITVHVHIPHGTWYATQDATYCLTSVLEHYAQAAEQAGSADEAGRAKAAYTAAKAQADAAAAAKQAADDAAAEAKQAAADAKQAAADAGDVSLDKVVRYEVTADDIEKFYGGKVGYERYTQQNNQSYLVGFMIDENGQRFDPPRSITVTPQGFSYSYAVATHT